MLSGRPEILPEAEEEKESHVHHHQASQTLPLRCQSMPLIFSDFVIDLIRPGVDSSAQI